MSAARLSCALGALTPRPPQLIEKPSGVR